MFYICENCKKEGMGTNYVNVFNENKIVICDFCGQKTEKFFYCQNDKMKSFALNTHFRKIITFASYLDGMDFLSPVL